MAQYGFAIDVSRCNGCGSCFLACKDEYTGNDHLPLSAAQPDHGQKWMRLSEIEQGQGSKIKMDYIPLLCQHCENPVCASGAPEGAVYTRPDGIVLIDPEKSKGCRDMTLKCPYGMIFWNEEKQIPQKCTLCAHMLDAGERTTRCVESCPTGALKFGDLEDPDSPVSQFLASKGDEIEMFKPEFGTAPRVKYYQLPKPFITGEVLCADRPEECVGGASVTLTCTESGKTCETKTDFFGDFTFKGLEKNAAYTVKAVVPGYFPKEISVRTGVAQNVGELVLERT